MTIGKLDLKSAEAPRLEDGSINYAAYGLSAADDPIVYTITKRAYADDGSTRAATGEKSSYTVYVGNATLSDTGYYAKLEGRDAVYILSPTVTPTLIKPVEAMVTPSAVYPMDVSSYLMVTDFELKEVNMSSVNAYSFLTGKGSTLITNGTTPIVDFSYKDILERDDTMYALHPFITNTKLMEGYFLDSNNISNALTLIYHMQPEACIQLGLTEEAIQQYIFGGKETADVHYLTFRYNTVEREAIIKKMPNETSKEFDERCRTKALELLKKYGITDVKETETLSSLLTMLEKLGIYREDNMLYDKLTHLQEVYAFCSATLSTLGYSADKLSGTQNTDLKLLSSKVDEVVKKLNEYQTGVRYDKNTLTVYIVNDVLISEQTNGKYYLASTLYDMIVEADAYNLAFLDWNNKSWYSQYVTWVELEYLTDLQVYGNNKEIIFSADNSASSQGTTDNLKLYQVINGVKKLIDYGAGIEHTYVTDTGVVTTEFVDAITNFKEFYEIFEYLSLNGVIDDKELEKMSSVGLSPEICRNLPDSECDLLLYYRAVDKAGNSIAKILRFYTYSGHAYLTVEVVKAFDENGNPTNDWQSQSKPENAKGFFYVDAKYMAKILSDAEKIVNAELVDTSSKD